MRKRFRGRGMVRCLTVMLGGAVVSAAQAGMSFNDKGQVIELSCDPHHIADNERVACGADAPTWVNLHDAKGRLRRQLRHFAGRQTGARQFSALEVLTYEEERTIEREGDPPRDIERVHWRTFYPNGKVHLDAVSVDGRAQSEREFDEAGVQIRLTLWDQHHQRTETRWYPNRVVASQECPTIHLGIPARMIQEYWENGQIKSRGMFDAKAQRLGVFQTFHLGAGLASESYYENGRLVRRREFDRAGRLLIEEAFQADGKRRLSMQR